MTLEHTSRSSVSVLIVDDNPVMRRTIRRFVRDLAGEVTECDDGAVALRSYEECMPDWVLMDVDMPRKDGLAATREICAAFPAARVVIVTKYQDATVREAARSAGACAFVPKENLMELQRIISGPATVARFSGE